MGSLEGNKGYGRADYFLVGKDFPSYIECQEKVDEAYQDQRVSDQSFSVCYMFCHLYAPSSALLVLSSWVCPRLFCVCYDLT